MIDDARAQASGGAHPLHGEYDLANAVELAVRLHRIAGDTRGDVVLECSDVRFWDSSAIAVLVDVHERLAAGGRRLRLRNVPATPRRVVEVLGLAQWLDTDGPEADPTP